MAILVLGAKTLTAVLLLAAGAAKLADLPGFAASVRLFLPRSLAGRLPRPAALCIAVGEAALGAASLAAPLAGWVNFAVLAVACGFVVVAGAGYRWHRGLACRCFGALSRRAFSAAGIGRAALIALGAAAATMPASRPLMQVGVAGRLGLLAGGAMVAVCAYSAAAALGAKAAQDPGWVR